MAHEHIIADATAIADEMNRRSPREPERHTFVWLDHQKYHADDQTIAMLWQIKGWDRSPDQAVAHCAFDHAKQQGQVLDGPVSHHELAAQQHDRTPLDADTRPLVTPSWSKQFKVGDTVVSSQERYDLHTTRQRVEPQQREPALDPGHSL